MHILYVYDVTNWAIHNVGRFWAGLLADSCQFTFCSARRLPAQGLSQIDLIWWGFSRLAPLAYYGHQLSSSLSRGPSRRIPIVSVVHDPCELYPKRAGWKSARPYLWHLSRFSRLAVTSHEMQQLLSSLGYECTLINTNSMLPLGDEDELMPDKPRIFSRARWGNIRKNAPLARAVRKASRGWWETCDLYFDNNIRPLAEYLALIDAHNCCMCTSWQEGGPLPLMDALQRGCVALTTPVGQTDELIQEGVNGFICRTRDDFVDHIRYLAVNPDVLLAMRRNALHLAATRDSSLIRAQLQEFLSPYMR